MNEREWTLCADKIRSGYVPLKWVMGQTARMPAPKKTTYLLLTGFHAAGKHYRNIQQLSDAVDGLNVIAFRERFPCFDSYDYLHEDRYFRWFFLRGQGTLTMVYYADRSKNVEVTEDVAEIKQWQWEELRKAWNV